MITSRLPNNPIALSVITTPIYSLSAEDFWQNYKIFSIYSIFSAKSPLFRYTTTSWHRVVTTATPRMATKDATHGKPSATERTVLFYRLLGILRTGGRVAACGGREWRDASSVECYERQHHCRQYGAKNLP